MSADFAKIVRTSDGAQVLFFRDNGDDGPLLVQFSIFEGMSARVALEFGNEEDWQKAFDKADTQAAEQFRRSIKKMISTEAAA